MGVDDDERLPACRNSYMLTTALIPFRKPETCDVQSSQAQPAVEEQVQFFQLGAGFSIPLESACSFGWWLMAGAGLF
jgi:hypothetical protein